MDTTPLIIPLEEARDYDVTIVGSKARNLSLFLNQGFKVPEGFSITTKAYLDFVKENKLAQKIDSELNRKSWDDMRWEEMWDASLRIRSSFLKTPLKPALKSIIRGEIAKYGSNVKFSVRSSSPVEDSAEHSFAGIHESYLNISPQEIPEYVKLVWASLWSDRAILYRRELSLNPLLSSISVLVQRMVEEPVSGLAFSKNPTGRDQNLVIEAVKGLCSDLVDNIKEPEEWKINPQGGVVEHHRPEEYPQSLLTPVELENLRRKILSIQDYFQNPVDVEWTGIGSHLTILQVRPITSVSAPDKEREWYLTLTPHFEKLKKLAQKVEEDLIPQLETEVRQLSGESPQGLSREQLARKLKGYGKSYFKWKDIYWDEFIPFAHGIRNFGTYYNDLVRPEDPYQFMELLKTKDLLAIQRNQALQELHQQIKVSVRLESSIKELLDQGLEGDELLEALSTKRVTRKFLRKFKKIMEEYLNVSYDNQSIKDHPELILRHILLLKPADNDSSQDKAAQYLDELYEKAGSGRRAEVDEVLRIGRLSWKLRDDDNLLLGRLESQLLSFLHYAGEILKKEGKLKKDVKLTPEDCQAIYKALQDPEKKPLQISRHPNHVLSKPDFQPRQMVGQPSSPGLVTGPARVVRGLDDFKKLKSGDILVVDAVEPQMTFLVSLASGIVERRGGMLVHSSIIARELGIPAVNGVSRATEYIKNGDVVTVNGYLGLVVVGEAEFDLERKR